MTFEYEKPVVEIISFVSAERLARAERDAREGGNTTGNDQVNLPSIDMSEGVEDWGE